MVSTADRGHGDPLPEGWVPLENRMYRRQVNYHSLPWKVQPSQLSNAIVAAAPFAGPVAIIPDAGWGLSFGLAVYSLSGRLIARFDRLREKAVPPFRAIAVSWSDSDLLSIVYNDGFVLRMPGGIHMATSTSIRALPEDLTERVHDAAISASGEVVMRTVSGQVFLVNSQNSVQTEALHAPPPADDSQNTLYGSIAAVRPDNVDDSTNVEMLIVDKDGNLVASNSTAKTMWTKDEISQIAASYNGRYLAALDATTGVLGVRTIDLQTEIARVDLVVELSLLGVENTHSDFLFDAKTVDAIAWVGSDAIGVLYREHLVLVGPRGGIAVLNLDESCLSAGIALNTEPDGLRVISHTSVHFVQMVPESLNTVMCQKLSAGYKLIRATAQVDTVSNAADVLIRYRLLRELRDSSQLLEGAKSCVSAAYVETAATKQTRLLNAAAYGVRHNTVFSANEKLKESEPARGNEFPPSRLTHKVDGRSQRNTNMVPIAIAILRVMNAITKPDVGVPVSKVQFDMLGLSAVVARLARYGRHTLAIRLATFGGVSPRDVLAEWATATIRGNRKETDEALTVLIADRFDAVSRSYNTVGAHGSRRGQALPYVNAAQSAFLVGRSKCAELLLRREVRPAPKVAMYLRMGRESLAIMAAVASGDPELKLDTLGTILERKSVRETGRLLKSLPPALGNRAIDILATHLKQIGDLKALRLLYVETGRHRESVLVDIHTINRIEETGDYVTALENAAQAIGRGQGRRTCHFEMQALQHAADVAIWAMEVEKRGRLEPGTLRYASDGDLLARAVVDISDRAKRGDMLAKLRRELRVPDRRFFWVCLDSMGEIGDFESIEALSYSAGSGQAPPIGLSAFVDTCVKYDMEDEAAKYAMRIADLRDRARALARCGRGREAAEIASRLRNQQLLAEVQDLAARHVSNLALRKRRNTDSAEGKANKHP